LKKKRHRCPAAEYIYYNRYAQPQKIDNTAKPESCGVYPAILFLCWFSSGDASVYRKYRYVVSISIYRIVSFRPPQTFRHIVTPNFCFSGSVLYF